MTPKQKAQELVLKMEKDFQYFASREIAIQHALICVDNIISANPHSNPLNSDVHSTMNYWFEVKQEIQNL
jgi:hypothetical protein